MFLGCVLGIWIHLMLVNKVTYPLSPLLGLVVFIIALGFLLLRLDVFNKNWNEFWYWYNLWDMGALAY